MTPFWADIANGAFELIGAWFTWANVRAYKRDRHVEGVYWPTTAFFTAWGGWNCLYYPALGQWFSLFGAVVLVSGNAAWLAWVIYDKRWPQPEKPHWFIIWGDTVVHRDFLKGQDDA